jgi:hypothetical protein
MPTTILDCGHEVSKHSDITTGYGIINKKTCCYECCAKEDLNHMAKFEKITLYLSKTNLNNYCVSNWPGSLKIDCFKSKISRHNLAGKRYDVWFKAAGKYWHGVTYGDNTQICHCRTTKRWS